MSLNQKPFKRLVANRDRVGASDYNRAMETIEKLSRSLAMNGMIDSSGILTHKSPPSMLGQSKTFAVQHVATAGGDGVYDCYEMLLDATEWNDTAGDDRVDSKDAVEVEVLNLYELHCNATYVAALVAGDLLKAWRWTDDEGTSRWVGIPIMGGFVRQAKTKAAVGATTTISCKLVNQDDAEVGAAFTVNFRTTDSADMDAVWPILASGTYIFIENIAGKWWCVQTFGKLEVTAPLTLTAGVLALDYDTDQFQLDETSLQTKLNICVP